RAQATVPVSSHHVTSSVRASTALSTTVIAGATTARKSPSTAVTAGATAARSLSATITAGATTARPSSTAITAGTTTARPLSTTLTAGATAAGPLSTTVTAATATISRPLIDYRHKNQFTVKVASETNPPCIYDAKLLPGGLIVLADWDKNSVKLFNIQ
ncbi:LOW QUALITY PROTEIN: hypothetical protein PoB_005554300, partial [Plakobranchus ocellatus]